MVFAGRQTAFVPPALMSATLKQIADRTGVSPMTISRVLRGVGRVRVETRRRVLEVAEEMGHFRLKGVVFPPPIRQGHTDHNLKLLLPYSHSDLVMTELGQQFLTGLKQRLHETGGLLYTALFRSLEDIFEEARRHRIHGIILRQILPPDYVEKLQAHYPIVYAAADDFYGGGDRVSINENCCAARILIYLTFRDTRTSPSLALRIVMLVSGRTRIPGPRLLWLTDQSTPSMVPATRHGHTLLKTKRVLINCEFMWNRVIAVFNLCLTPLEWGCGICWSYALNQQPWFCRQIPLQ